MKNFQKILATGLIVVVPTGLFANISSRDILSAKFNSYDTRVNHTKPYHEIFVGKLQKKPKSGHIGVWSVSNKDIHVDKYTSIKGLDGGLQANDKLSIATKNIKGKTVAIEIIKI